MVASPASAESRLVQTGDITRETTFGPGEALQVYNGLDCCVTTEVWEQLNTIYGDRNLGIYNFEKALQAPYMEIMLRGFRVDQINRRKTAEALRARQLGLQVTLDRMARAVWDRDLNSNSPDQLKKFFYQELRLPEVWLNQKGERKLSTNREALEKLDVYMHARPFVSCILSIRDIGKQLSVLESDIDSDGRFRTSYNIAGTETGRPSSSTNAYGTGGNAQNIAPGLRNVFVADPGYKIVVIDLEQVEARDVGFFCGCLFNDWSFLDACEGGDLHTNNAKRVWKELDWPGSPALDRAMADRLFYREFSYRDMAKRGSHLSNYSGSAYTMARSLKIPQELATDFQDRYVRGPEAAFPCIARWWDWTAFKLQTEQRLVTPFGRERHFFGRPNDDTTLREAIAFLPQSTTADRMNLGLWRVWKYAPQVQLLAQTYDSISFQVREAEVDDSVRQALDLIKVELVSPSGRKYVVPGEAKIGWNWAYYDEKKNYEGLKKWSPAKSDERERRTGMNRLY